MRIYKYNFKVLSYVHNYKSSWRDRFGIINFYIDNFNKLYLSIKMCLIFEIFIIKSLLFLTLFYIE